MTEQHLQCWKCGESLEDMLLPLARAEACRRCNADLHVCRLCEFYDRSVASACREPIAEYVANKERANFCGYFTPRSGAYSAQGGKEAGALGALGDLFGLGEKPDEGSDATGADSAPQDLNRLFGLDKKPGK